MSGVGWKLFPKFHTNLASLFLSCYLLEIFVSKFWGLQCQGYGREERRTSCRIVSTDVPNREHLLWWISDNLGPIGVWVGCFLFATLFPFVLLHLQLLFHTLVQELVELVLIFAQGVYPMLWFLLPNFPVWLEFNIFPIWLGDLWLLSPRMA